MHTAAAAGKDCSSRRHGGAVSPSRCMLAGARTVFVRINSEPRLFFSSGKTPIYQAQHQHRWRSVAAKKRSFFCVQKLHATAAAAWAAGMWQPQLGLPGGRLAPFSFGCLHAKSPRVAHVDKQ